MSAAIPRKTSERDVQRTILDWLRLYRIFHYRQNTGGMTGSYKGKKWHVKFAVKGCPDIIAVVGGRYIGIECKRGTGTQSENQIAFQLSLEAAGGYYILARSLEDVTEALGPLARKDSHERT